MALDCEAKAMVRSAKPALGSRDQIVVGMAHPKASWKQHMDGMQCDELLWVFVWSEPSCAPSAAWAACFGQSSPFTIAT